MLQPAPATARRAAFSRTYPACPEQIRAVRSDLRALLDGCPATDDVILCTSELAANAALHSNSGRPGGQLTIRATLRAGDYVRIEVQDQGAPWHWAARDTHRDHGLDILHALAADWGIDGDYRARTFWARFGWLPGTAPAPPIPAATSQTPGQETPAATDSPSPAAIIARARAAQRGQWTAILDGQRLRYLRVLHGLSQERLACQAGLSLATIARLERQPRPRCRTYTMIAIAIAISEHPAAITRDLIPATRHQPQQRT